MNTEVHEYIARTGFELLPEEIKKNWRNEKGFILKTSAYPDMFADRGMSLEEKNRIDPEAGVYLEPSSPRALWYKKLLQKVIDNPTSQISDVVPEKMLYLFPYYLNNTILCLKRGEKEKAAKFAGVFSHWIGDMAQPIHLLNPKVIDLLVKCPDEFLSLELHAGIEGISGKPDMGNYKPEILGDSFPRALMALYRKIVKMTEESRYTIIPMVKAIYSGQQKDTIELAGISVKLAACLFSDFLRTAWALSSREKFPFKALDLTEYPWIGSTVDMLYRYRPIKNFSLIPYSGERSYPISLLDEKGSIIRVSGLGVIPYLGPFKTATGYVKERDARVEFFVWPQSYAWFRAKVGLNPLFTRSEGKVTFRIFADDKLIGKCGPLSPRTPAVDFKVKLPQKIHFLTLSMLTIEEPSKPIAEKHPRGVWGDPVLDQGLLIK